MEDPAVVASLLRRRAAEAPLWLAADGTSMGRRFAATSEVLVEARNRTPRLGEVWVFCDRNGERMVHRFVRVHRGGYQFHGDGNLIPDVAVPADWLVGEAVARRSAARGPIPLTRRAAIWPLTRAAVLAAARRGRGLLDRFRPDP